MSGHLVKRVLEEAQRKYRIKVIYAYLGGSNQMNFNDERSDWDVFFIFNGEQDEIFLKTKYNNYRIHLHGRNMSIIDNTNHWHIDGFKNPKEIFIDNIELRQNYTDNIDSISLPEFRLSLVREIKLSRDKIAGIGNGRFHKKNYIQALIHVMRLLWTFRHNSANYPVDVREIMIEFKDKTWFTTLRQLIITRRTDYSSLNTELFNIINS